MRTIFAIVGATIIMLSASLVHVRGDVPQLYIAEDLGSLGGPLTIGTSINARGDIAGYAQLATGEYHAFRYSTERGLEDLGALGGPVGQAYGINDAGDVVGAVIDPTLGFASVGFVAKPGQPMEVLVGPGHAVSYATAINADGVITGTAYTAFPGVFHVFRWFANGAFQDLGTPGLNSVGWDINGSGQITGYQHSSGGQPVTAFRYADETGLVDLGTLGGINSAGSGINASGVAVGWADTAAGTTHAFRSRPGMPIEDLGTLGGTYSTADAINDDGTIVGVAVTSTGHWNPFVYTDADGMIDLTDRIPPASGFRILEIPYAINNAGQIVLTYGVLGAIRTYRLTPTTPDTEAPTIASVTATPNTLWPPDGTMKAISLAISVSDNRDANPSCTIASVSVTDGSTTVLAGSDVVIAGNLSVSVRAVRGGGGTGRTYTITVGCSDASHNQSTASVTVIVPHDQSAR